MHLTKYILRRNGQICIIQGMCHFGSKELYVRLQSDLDYATQINFTILTEGIHSIDIYPKQGDIIGKITREWLRTIKFFYEEYVALLGGTTQSQMIEYPIDNIDADMSLAELCQEIQHRNLIFYFFIHTLLMKCVLACARIQKRWSRSLRFSNRLHNKMTDWFFSRTDELILHQRDIVATEYIEIWSEKSNRIFVHFGQAHVPGIIALLKSKKWEVINTIKLDVDTL